MSDAAAGRDIERQPTGLRGAMREVTGYWWVWLVSGIAWLIVSVVILQFDDTSVRTVGIIIGFMFLYAGIQEIAVAASDVPLRWVWGGFGLLLIIAGIVALANPVETFAGLADMLGFLFLLVGVWWIVRAFLERSFNELWWLGLIAGVLMTVVAFWTAGQFFIDKAYILLVFAGIWALLEGLSDIARAFAVKGLHQEA